jgi:hypothetical protein
MAETGWPLIPREALPEARPVRSSKGRAAKPATDAGRQLSIFGAETTESSPLDLAGLLVGPGRLGRMGGTARVTVRVDGAWRVHVLVAELVSRGLVVNWRRVEEPAPPEPEPGQEQDPAQEDPVVRVEPRFEVRTAYSSRLNALARAWPAAADDLFLSGPRLRLWVAAAGRPGDDGYELGFDDAAPRAAAAAALRRAGLEGTLSDQGPTILITGRKRLRRLAELVGERPEAAPEALWPGCAGA